MRQLRYRLVTLLAATALIAVALAALRSGDWFWARVLFTVTLALNLGAVLAAIYCTGSRRAFWIGFALFGWTSWSITNVDCFRIAEHQLFAKQLQTMLKEHVPEGNAGIVIEPNGISVAIFSFQQIVYSTFSLAFSMVGGIIGCCCFSQGTLPDSSTLDARRQLPQTRTTPNSGQCDRTTP